MTDAAEGGVVVCEVCNDPVDTETDFEQYDPQAPVYTDEGAYHLGCEDGMFDETYVEIENEQEGDVDR